MPGLREAGLLGASVAVTGGLVYAVWTYVSAQRRSSSDDHNNKPTTTAAEITTTTRQTETRGAEPDDQPGGGVVDHQQQPEPEPEQHGSPGGDGSSTLEQEEQPVVVESLVTAQCADNTSSEAVVVESSPVEKGKQVLVLGLDGAGKTSLLHCFSTGALEQEVVPTNGFNAVSINREDLQIEFLEIGGREDLRPYWQKYMPRALVLVFVVDASDRDQFPLAKKHLHELLPGSHPQLPLVVLSNKVDLPGSCSITELHEQLSLSDVGDQRKLYLIATSASQSADAELNSGVQDARDLIVQLVCEG